MKILILNGPNLNLLGSREPQVYGSETFEQVLAQLRTQFATHALDYFQSNHEGALIDKLQAAGNYDGVVLNAGAYAHTSIALHDAIKAIAVPVVEVHISNVYARESYRHHSVISAACKGVIVGLGTQGYALAVQALEGNQ